MAAQVAAEQQQDKARAAAAAAAAAMLEQQQAAADAELAQVPEQPSVPDAAAVDVLAAAGQQQRQGLLQDGQPRAGLDARPLGSDEYSGSGEAVYTGDGEEDVLGEDGLPEDADRDLSVACQQAEENKLSFQLKFTEPEGECLSIAGRLGPVKAWWWCCPAHRAQPRGQGEHSSVHTCCKVACTSCNARLTVPPVLLCCWCCRYLLCWGCRAAGHCKTVEFTFDMREDTADCIAKEMMDDLSLSEDEAAKIAKKIKEEIGRLVSPGGGELYGVGLRGRGLKQCWCAYRRLTVACVRHVLDS